jgi:hypothetical protein
MIKEFLSMWLRHERRNGESQAGFRSVLRSLDAYGMIVLLKKRTKAGLPADGGPDSDIFLIGF